MDAIQNGDGVFVRGESLTTHTNQMFTLFSANLSKQVKGFTEFVSETGAFPFETIDTKAP